MAVLLPLVAFVLVPLPVRGYDLLAQFLELSHSTSSPPPCNPALEQTINSCSHELANLGVFSQFPGNQGEPLSLNELKKRSREYFVQICHGEYGLRYPCPASMIEEEGRSMTDYGIHAAYNRFNQCIGGSYIKQACYAQEPIKARFAVADAALAFVCGSGYNSMLVHWDCFLSAASRADVTGCEARIGDGFAPQEQLDTMTTACSYVTKSLPLGNVCRVAIPGSRALRDYAECIRMPIHTQCGLESWETVVEAIERPVQVYLPYCTLAAGSLVPSLSLLFSLWLLVRLV